MGPPYGADTAAAHRPALLAAAPRLLLGERGNVPAGVYAASTALGPAVVLGFLAHPGHYPGGAVEIVRKILMKTIAEEVKRARELMMLSEGCVVMMLIHRDRRYVAAAAEAAKQLVRKKR